MHSGLYMYCKIICFDLDDPCNTNKLNFFFHSLDKEFIVS